MGSYYACALPGPCQRSRSVALAKRIAALGTRMRSLLSRPRHKHDSQYSLVRCQPLLIGGSPYTACELAVQFFWQSLEQGFMQSWIMWVGSPRPLLNPGGAAEAFSSLKIDLADVYKEHNNLHGFTKAF